MDDARRRLCIGLITTGLAGCGSFATLPAGTDHGSMPSDYEALIKAEMEYMLKDPESARFRFGTPTRAYSNKGLIYGGGIAFVGHAVTVHINARNSYGGYTGFKEYTALFSNGSLWKVIEGNGQPLLRRVF